VAGDGVDDLGGCCVGLIVGVKQTRRGPIVHEPKVQVGQIAIVDTGPVIAALADHADQAIQRRLQQVADNPAGTAVDNSRPDDDRAKRCVGSGEHEPFMFGTPGHQIRRMQRRIFSSRRGGITEHPHTGGVDQARVASGRLGG